MERCSEVMESVAEGVFEALAFMVPSPPGGENGGAGSPLMTASVGFTGPFSGTLVVRLGLSLLDLATANMLGLADGDVPTPEQSGDALREVANVLCGNLLPRIAGDEAEFAMDPPQLWSGFEEAAPAAYAARAVLSIEDRPLELLLLASDEALAAATQLAKGGAA
jgi:hypothetical protein